jgi:Calcineurin-like phosphoesterase
MTIKGPGSPEAASRTPTDPGWQMRGVWPPVPRLVAIGDLHGDLGKAKAALRTAGVLDADTDSWCGGTTVAVQVGDILDRGDQEVEIFHLLNRLQRQAAVAGGRLHVMNGNHESMNVLAAHTPGGRFKYATPGGLAAFAAWRRNEDVRAAFKLMLFGSKSDRRSETQKHVEAACRAAAPADAASVARAEALCMTCAFTKQFLHGKPVALQVGSTLFTHGGWVPEHAARGIDAINADADAWMRGTSCASSTQQPPALPPVLGGSRAVVWARGHGWPDPSKCDCDDLAKALTATPSAPARVVVGHTIQKGGINAACGGAAIRVDVGMSAGCGDGGVQVLEILDDGRAGMYVLKDTPEGVIRTRVPTAEAMFANMQAAKQTAAKGGRS